MIWTFNGKPFTADMIGPYYGFVYKITNTLDGRFYIGRKFFYSKRSKIVKGKKKSIKAASDWEKYYGSNDALKEDTKRFGEEFFSREILHLCLTKGTANYFEVKEQMARDVLTRDDSYNTWIMCKCHRSHIKFLP